MLQRLIYSSFEMNVYRKKSRLLFIIPTRAPWCQQCGSRLYSRYKLPVIRNIYERTFSNRYGLFNYKFRCYTTQVDTQKKNEHFESVKEKNPLKTTEKINVKLKTSELKRLFTLAEPEKWTLAGAIGFLIVSSSVTMAIPFSLGKVLDIIYGSTSDLGAAREKLDTICLMLCGVFLVGGLCNFGRVYLMSISGHRMTQALREKGFNAMMRQEPAWFSKTSTGELSNRLSADTQLVGRNLSQNVSDGLRSLFMVAAGTGMMFYMSPSLALIGLCVVPPVSVLVIIYGRFVRGITRQLQDALAEANEFAEEKISNIKTVKAFSKEEAECQRYAQRLEKVLNLAYKESLAIGSFYGITGLAGNTIIILVLYYGGDMVATGQLTVGNLTSFLLYAAYVGISISGLSSFYTEMNRGIGAATRLWEIIDRVPTIPVSGGKKPSSSPRGELILDKVHHSYSEKSVLKGVELCLEPGKSIALVGRSGCGKSTTALLMIRLYNPEEGRILLDGVDISELDPRWLRSHIGFVGQEPVLFKGTIKDNILYGASEDLDDPELLEKNNEEDQAWYKAAKTAQLLELVKATEEGWDRQVGAGGGQLSGGQKQRVAIARAIIKNPRILILDEATSALDAHSEYLVEKALKEITKDRTVLIIAHRLSTIQSADEIAVMDNGIIVEKGQYQELISKPGGFFKELMNHQTFAKTKRDQEDDAQQN